MDSKIKETEFKIYFRLQKHCKESAMYRFWVCLLLLITPMSVAAPITANQNKAQFRQLELRIKDLQAEMDNNRHQFDHLQRQLQHSEEDIGEIARRLETIHGALTDKQNTLADLEQQQQAQQTQLETQRQVLAQQIRATYMMGRQDYLKLLLNQEEPFLFGRVLTYYDYFNRTKSHQITEIKTTLQRLLDLKKTIKIEKTGLKKLFISQSQKKAELELSYKERQKILVQLANTLESQSKELKRLQNDKHKLATLLGYLGDALKDIPNSLAQQVDFTQLKGRLPYPIQGKVIHQFGQRLVAHLKWQGMLIAAPKGEKVRAIAAGRVAFAQWFRNFGLLVIIEHGEEYMSLYAHNQSLYIETGDWVNANDIIATVGNSGGQKTIRFIF
ncbi:peptidase, family M23/M37 domain protein [Beggiatoa sp. PS]|nr:peptidase, family M23/M37 domain protein [Beggiatoa sp. PS]